MIELGNYNTLKILRSTSIGLFLGDEEGTEILLPNKYVPEDCKINEDLEVFCYLDNDERPIATTLDPKIIRNNFAFLEVVEVGAYGAFLDWGLEKQLLVPFREQAARMEEGKKYVVYCFMDEKTFRLVGSSRIDRFLSNQDADYEFNKEVDILVYRKTPLGWEVIIENKHKGLVFANDVFKPIKTGDRFKGYIKNIRPDKKNRCCIATHWDQSVGIHCKYHFNKTTREQRFFAIARQVFTRRNKERITSEQKSFQKRSGDSL